MSHPYTEDQLVELPAIGLFAELGWTTVLAMEETFGATGTLQRETKGEVVLVVRLRAALERLNPAWPSETITAAVDELIPMRTSNVPRRLLPLFLFPLITATPFGHYGSKFALPRASRLTTTIRF